MIITAKASHLTNSPRKVNLVAKSIVGLPAERALEKLQFTFKRASLPVAKVLKQAIGNATNNLKLNPKTLIVETALATKGRVLKRGMMGGRSRYKPFERTASHLTINLKSVAGKIAPAPKAAAKVTKSSEAKIPRISAGKVSNIK